MTTKNTVHLVNHYPIWHPYTQMKGNENPIMITKAKGAKIWDGSGKPYIDAIASWWVNIHGHSHPKIAQAIARQARQLEHVIFAGFTHPPALALARLLLKNLPDTYQSVFYSDNGSTAVEVALKMAFQYFHNQQDEQKKKIIIFEKAYHGDTFGAMSVSEKSVFSIPFEPYLFEVYSLPLPTNDNFERVKKQFIAYLETNHCAAFLFEPLVQGVAGMQVYEAVFLDEMIALAHKRKVLTIADEVMTGFGRTGKTFAIDHLKNKPDILCLSKGITGGFLPLGATITDEKIYQAFYAEDKRKAFFHGHSYTGNPLSCAAAVASLTLLMTAQSQQKIKTIEAQHRIFKEKINSHPKIATIRHLGTILAIEIKTPEGANYFCNLRDIIYRQALSEGVLLRPLGNIIYVLPPYCITKTELKKVYKTIQNILEKLP